MNNLLAGIVMLLAVLAVPVSAPADVSVSVGIALPPPVLFPAPPAVVVLPDTEYVYAVPNLDVDIYFWNGWWWRLWDGRWYRSHYYDRGWAYYGWVPRFYYDVDPGWRGYYRDRSWRGHHWHYRHIPPQQLRRHWKGWRDTRHWERRRTWDVQGYRPPPPRQRQEWRRQRREEYRRSPDAQRQRQGGGPSRPPQRHQERHEGRGERK